MLILHLFRNVRRLGLVLGLLLLPALASADPAITSVLLPQYMQGMNGTNNDRTPFAFRVQVNGLTASATYNYFNQVVMTTDTATASGSGNPIFVSTSGDFYRSSGPTLATAGQYGSFTTDATGSASFWCMLEPTSNGRFTPGTDLFMRISLNDGAAGTTAATRLTTAESVRVIHYASALYPATGVRCTSSTTSVFVPKNFIFLYDDTTGSGRPIAGTSVESDGAAAQSSYVAFYRTAVEAQAGAWGTLVPNALPNGIRRVEQRSLSDGSIVATGTATSADGTWPVAGSTANPAGGSATPLAFTATELPVALSSFQLE